MQLISPEKVIRGENAWLKAIPEIKKISRKPLILGKSKVTEDIRLKIYKDLKEHSFDAIYLILNLIVVMRILIE